MSRPSTDEIAHWVGLVVLDSGGESVGRCTRAYADDETGNSEWLAVEMESGQSSYLVPVSDARRDGDEVRVAFARTLISTSPELGAPTFVSLEDEERLYQHYAIPTPLQEESSGTSGSGRHRLVRMVGGADDSGSTYASTGTGTTTSGDLSVSSTPSASEGPDVSRSAPYAATSDVSSSADSTARTEQLGAGGTSPSTPPPAPIPAPEPDWQSAAWEDSGSSTARKAATVAVPAGALAAAAVAGTKARRSRQRQKALAAQRKSAGSAAALIPAAATVLALVVRKVRGRRSSEPTPVTIDQAKAPVVSTTTTAALPDPASMPGAGAPVADLPAGSSESGRRRRLRMRRNGQHIS